MFEEDEIAPVAEAEIAPDFTTANQRGESIKLTDYRGQRVVLYFFHEDDRVRRKKIGASFCDAADLYQQKNIRVFGISTASVKSWQKFIRNTYFPFDLLADEDGKIVSSYGVCGVKFVGGMPFWAIKRSTFLIDEQGKIVKIFSYVRKMNFSNYAFEILSEFGD